MCILRPQSIYQSHFEGYFWDKVGLVGVEITFRFKLDKYIVREAGWEPFDYECLCGQGNILINNGRV